jgi:hypothetical protein
MKDANNEIVEAVTSINSADVIPWLTWVIILALVAFGFYQYFFVFRAAWMKIIHELEGDLSSQGFETINLMIQIELISADKQEYYSLGRIQKGAENGKDLYDFHEKILEIIKEIREMSYGKNLNGVYEKTKAAVTQIDNILKEYSGFDKRTLEDFAQLAIEANQAQKRLAKCVGELTNLLASLTPKNELPEEPLEEQVGFHLPIM